MHDVVVVGAGIAGLSSAFSLENAGADVVVLEARSRVGGVIHSEQRGGYLLEHGPNSIQSRTPVLERLIDELGLAECRVEASEAARNRYIVKGGQPVAAPSSPAALFTSSLFGAGAKLRLMREPFVPPADPDVEETVAQFIRRRLGDTFLDYGMNPFVAGVYAGDPERLSVKHAFPSLVELEQEHGSIVKGQMEKRRDAATAAVTGRMFSFRDGIAALPASLSSRLSDVRLEHPVDEIQRAAGGWAISAAGERIEARAVIYAAPLHGLDRVEHPFGDALRPAAAVTYPPLSVVYHGYRAEDVRHPLDGFGVLVPEVERGFQILGTLFTSSIFPRRANEGRVLLTTFVGGMRHPELATKTPDDLFALVRRDLERLLGVRGTPELEHIVTWPHAIPQYELGYDAVLEAIGRVESDAAGWFMAGNYRGGVSVGEAAASGDTAGRRCADYLNI